MDSLILDNPVFNVKGQGKEMLLEALKLGIACVGHSSFEGYRIDDKHGIVLYWTGSDKEGYQKFMLPSKPEDITDQVFQAVSNIEVEIDEKDEHWDRKITDDYDIDNDLGWRLYTERWGHIDEEWQACLAIVPSYLWTSK